MKRIKNAKGHGGKAKVELEERDLKELRDLTLIGCPVEEIAHKLGTSHETLQRNYMPYLEKARAERNAMVRSWQMKSAREGNVTMLIWLGKVMLKQKDDVLVDLAQANKSQLSKQDQEELLKFMRKAEKFIDDTKGE